jgi:(p)ppGpp synthase/HD superfamily hydrolase
MILGEKFLSALRYATHLHGGQVRKSTNIAYISHPLGVASLVIEGGGDEDQAIGGLLHDIAEDCGGELRLREIEYNFGPRVEAIVRGCSDSLVADSANKAPYRQRKKSHIVKMSNASHDVILVSLADKTHNARAIATDFQLIGDQVWGRFNAPVEDIRWYYRSMYEVLEKRDQSKFLLTALCSAMKSFGA